MYTIRFIPHNDLDQILPFLQLINTELSLTLLTERLQEMKKYDYKCIGVFDGDKLIGVSGIWILYKHYIGKHAEPDNVMLLPEYRNKSIGKKLMEFIYAYAKEQGCETIELNAYLENEGAHKFWKSEGFTIVGYHFQKNLK